MHRHNFDLIAEYAQGSTGDDSRARALVDSCDRCREIYNEQKFALQSLATASPMGTNNATMTEHEKAALHRDVWTELRSPATTAGASNPWWRTSWAMGTASLIVVGVGLIGVLSNSGGSDAATDSFSEIGSGLSQGEVGRFNSDGSDNPSLAPETTSTAATADLAEEAAVEEITSEVRSTDGVTSAYYGESAPDETTDEEECLERAGLTGFFATHEFEDLTNLIVALPEDQFLSTTPIVFVDPENCTIVHRDD